MFHFDICYADVLIAERDRLRFRSALIGTKCRPISNEFYFFIVRRFWLVEVQMLQIRRFCFCFLIGIAGWLGELLANGDDPVPIRGGDINQLNDLKALQSTHRNDLIDGTWEGVVERDNSTTLVKIQWHGFSSKIDFEISPNENWPEIHRSGVAFRNAHSQGIFFDKVFYGMHYSGLGRSFIAGIDCIPRECWFSFQNITPWEKFLEYDQPYGDVIEFSIAEDESEIRVDRLYRDGTKLRIFFAKSFDLRISRYLTVGNKVGNTNVEGEFEWARTDEDLVYPKNIKHWSYLAGSGRGAPIFSLSTKKFGLSSESVPKDFFEIEFPIGTAIQKCDAMGRHLDKVYIGGKDEWRKLEIRKAGKLLRTDARSTINGNR